MNATIGFFRIFLCFGYSAISANAEQFEIAEKDGKAICLTLSQGVIFKTGKNTFLQIELETTQKQKSQASVDSRDERVWRRLNFGIEIEMCTLKWTQIGANGIASGEKSLCHVMQLHEDRGGTTIAGSVDANIGDFKFSWNQNWTDEVMLYMKAGTAFSRFPVDKNKEKKEDPKIALE